MKRWFSQHIFALWPKKMHEYEEMEEIGNGSSGSVVAAECKFNKRCCAIKKVSMGVSYHTQRSGFHEAMLLRALKHENVQSLYTSFFPGSISEYWIVMSLAKPGSLRKVIKCHTDYHSKEKGVFTETAIAAVLKMTLKGLAHMHKRSIIHRDIKAANLLVNDWGVVKIADFGSAAYRYSKSPLYGCSGTIKWMAPETHFNLGHHTECDIWSVGIVAVEMALGDAKVRSIINMFHWMQDDTEPVFVEDLSLRNTQYPKYHEGFKTMLMRMLHRMPENRPSAQELLKDPFLQQGMCYEELSAYFKQFVEPETYRPIREDDHPPASNDDPNRLQEAVQAAPNPELPNAQDPDEHSKLLATDESIISNIFVTLTVSIKVAFGHRHRSRISFLFNSIHLGLKLAKVFCQAGTIEERDVMIVAFKIEKLLRNGKYGQIQFILPYSLIEGDPARLATVEISQCGDTHAAVFH